MPSCYSQATNMSPESGLSIAIIFEAYGFFPKMTVTQFPKIFLPKIITRVLIFFKNDAYTRVSANWWLKNLYDVIRRKFPSYSVKSFPLLSIGKEKRENKFKFSSSALEHFSTDPE